MARISMIIATTIHVKKIKPIIINTNNGPGPPKVNSEHIAVSRSILF